MPSSYRDLEFIDHNSERAYPLASDASAKDSTGTFTLPPDFLVGMRLPVNWRLNVSPQKFFLRNVLLRSSGCALTFAYSGSLGVKDVASVNIPLVGVQRYSQYTLSGLGDFADSRGFVVISSVENLKKQPAGSFNFDFIDGRLEPDVIAPSIRNVSAMQVLSAGVQSPLLTGVVRLAAGANIRLTAELLESGVYRVVISAISGEGLTDECVCYDDGQPITSLNGIPPEAGAVSIVGNNCFEVTTAQAAVIFNNLCSKPCCGPEDLVRLTETAESLWSKSTTLENFLVALEAKSTATDMIFLGSRLGDRTCTPECD
jgi:hypothetical protein